jgi:exonuclease VII small subunit
MRGSFRKNYAMFEELCGNVAMANVVIATTKWDQISEEVATVREEQLKGKFWASTLSLGCVTARYMHTHKSAWDIVDLIVHKRLNALQIQQELVDLGKALPDTAAGITLRKQLQDALKEYETTVQQKRSAAASQKGSDEQTPNYEEAQKRYEAAEARVQEAEQKLQAILDQIQQLKIPISTRIMRFFGLG